MKSTSIEKTEYQSIIDSLQGIKKKQKKIVKTTRIQIRGISLRNNDEAITHIFGQVPTIKVKNVFYIKNDVPWNFLIAIF